MQRHDPTPTHAPQEPRHQVARCPHCDGELIGLDESAMVALPTQSSPSSNATRQPQLVPPLRVDSVRAADKSQGSLTNRKIATLWTLRGLLLRLVAILLLGVCVACLLLLLSPAAQKPVQHRPLVAAPAVDARPTSAAPSPVTPLPKPLATAETGSNNNRLPGSPASPRSAIKSIVSIRSNNDTGVASLGAGFVVNAKGWIATNYHVIAEATEASVTFANGASYDIAGYVAIDRDSDLAILQLDQPPQLEPLSLATQPELDQLPAVFAIGHPRGLDFSLSDGRVSRRIHTRELPGRSRQFISSLGSSSTDHHWIQHTAELSPGSSGGPLLTVNGHVAGVNTWVDAETRFGYALHVEHLQQLLKRPLPELTPLRQFARPSARSAELLRQLSGERIRELHRTARDMNWLPETESQYQQLQRLAWCVTVANLPSTFDASEALDSRLKELVTEADRVRRDLTGRHWSGLGQVTVINEFADRAMMEPQAGIVVFAKVERIVAGSRGQRGMLLRVAGQDQLLFIPLDGHLQHPEPEQHCLVLGVNYEGQVVRFGDNPLQLNVAPVIISDLIVPVSP